MLTENETARFQTKLNETTDKMKTLEKGVVQAEKTIKLQKRDITALDDKISLIGKNILLFFVVVYSDASEALSSDL